MPLPITARRIRLSDTERDGLIIASRTLVGDAAVPRTGAAVIRTGGTSLLPLSAHAIATDRRWLTSVHTPIPVFVQKLRERGPKNPSEKGAQ